MDSTTKRIWCRASICAVTIGLLIAGLAGCNIHPVEYTTSASITEVNEDFSFGDPEPVDILWVIDNSGSMCEEQTNLADSFSDFLEVFADENIDYQMGVTTTHQAPEGLSG